MRVLDRNTTGVSSEGTKVSVRRKIRSTSTTPEVIEVAASTSQLKACGRARSSQPRRRKPMVIEREIIAREKNPRGTDVFAGGPEALTGAWLNPNNKLYTHIGAQDIVDSITDPANKFGRSGKVGSKSEMTSDGTTKDQEVECRGDYYVLTLLLAVR